MDGAVHRVLRVAQCLQNLRRGEGFVSPSYYSRLLELFIFPSFGLRLRDILDFEFSGPHMECLDL